MAPRTVTAEVVRVHPEILGRPLASPTRRLIAFGLDFVLLLVPSVVVAVAAAYLTLWWTAPAALESLLIVLSGRSPDPEVAAMELAPLAPLLVRVEAPGLPPTVAVAVEEGDLRRAGEILLQQKLLINLALGDASRDPPLGTVRLDLQLLIPRLLRAVAMFGVAALYFSLLTARWRATLGKRLLGLEVVRLDGEPISLWLAFERFAGYIVSVGTLGIGLLDLWRDPNRRLAHDRLSHTAVVRRG